MFIKQNTTGLGRCLLKIQVFIVTCYWFPLWHHIEIVPSLFKTLGILNKHRISGTNPMCDLTQPRLEMVIQITTISLLWMPGLCFCANSCQLLQMQRVGHAKEVLETLIPSLSPNSKTFCCRHCAVRKPSYSATTSVSCLKMFCLDHLFYF